MTALALIGVVVFVLKFLASKIRGEKAMSERRTYRTEDGRFFFRFCFETISGGVYRIYIDDAPSYSAYGRDESLHATHRLRDGGRFYVCWTDSLRTFEHAKSVAKLWAEATARYLKTGQRF
jgi:hypothetical protein